MPVLEDAKGSDRPVVTLVLVSYNQEKYIRDAVEAAFAQTYSPLAIEISDDASADSTYEIIQEMCAAYRGPHTVMCSRNRVNLGISAHVNLVNHRATGELIIACAGDDISVPHRTERIVDSYLRSGRRSHYFYSMVRAMSESGELQGVYQSPGAYAAHSKLRAGLADYPLAIGASQAWTKRFVNAFAPMHRSVWAEDQIFGFRGMLLGPVGFIDEALVNYRSGSGITNSEIRFTWKRYLRNQLNVLSTYRQRVADAFAVKQRILGLVILAKLAFLTIFFPLSPLFSVLRRWQRRKGR